MREMNGSNQFAETRFFRAVLLAARVACSQMARAWTIAAVAAWLTFSAGQDRANGNPYYFDVNDATAGFGTPSGTYSLSGTIWTTSSAGTLASATLANGSQMTFGSAAFDFSGSTFTINADNTSTLDMTGLAISSSNASITLSGTGNLDLHGDQTWTVAAGSTLNESLAYQGVGLNCNGYRADVGGRRHDQFQHAPGL